MVALWIILGVIALILLLLWVRVVVTVHFNETIELSVKWLFLKFQIIPKPERKKKKEKPEKPREEKPKDETVQEPKKKKHEENMFVRFYHNRGFDGVLRLLQDAAAALGGMFRRAAKAFTIEDLRIRLRVSSYDAAQTAIKYGKVCSIVYPALGAIINQMRVKKHQVEIESDFVNGENDAAFHTVVSVRPLGLIHAGTVMAFQMLFKVVLQLLMHSKEQKSQVEKQQ